MRVSSLLPNPSKAGPRFLFQDRSQRGWKRNPPLKLRATLEIFPQVDSAPGSKQTEAPIDERFSHCSSPPVFISAQCG